MTYSKVIAIDGPSGSGKSTIARKLAESLNLLYIDTGAMFRALAFYADKSKIPFESGPEMEKFLNDLDLNYGKSEKCLIEVNGQNLTEEIREHQVSKLASIISQIPEVRTYLLNFQRGLTNSNICVMEGRDIGTVVFPESFCKFFVTASVEVRSQRRLDQLIESGDNSVSLDQVVKDVEKRDASDMNREVAPLKKADDAVLVDTSLMNLQAVLDYLKEGAVLKAQECNISL